MENNKRIKIYGIILGILLFVLLISGVTYAVLNWKSSNIAITGNSECLEVDSVKGSNITGSDLLLLDEGKIINDNKITITNGMVISNITAKIKSSCTLDGYLTINLKTTTLNSGFTSSGNSNGALKYVLASYDSSTYSTVSTTALSGKSFDIITSGSITSTGTIKIKETQLSKDTTLAYLVIFYIDGDKANNDIATGSTNFKTSIEGVVTQANLPTLSGNLATAITNLYNNSTKTETINNNVTYQYDRINSLMKDVGNNIRYYGATPNNYIYFNCSDYSNQSSSTCETWRIIGVFGNQVKLMRGSQIGTLAWDQDKNIDSTKTTYDNDWTTSSLKVLLNEKYYNGNTSGTVTYYSDSSGSTSTSLNMASIGIKNDATRNVIAETNYSLLGWNSSSVYADQMYEYERSTGKVYTGRPTEWSGKIALAYPSDYGYAADLGKCTQTLVNYDNSTCTANNWMKTIIAPNYGWLLAPDSGYSNYAWYVDSSGYVGNLSYACNASGVAPVLFLNSEIVTKAGTGTSSDPYQISV